MILGSTKGSRKKVIFLVDGPIIGRDEKMPFLKPVKNFKKSRTTKFEGGGGPLGKIIFYLASHNSKLHFVDTERHEGYEVMCVSCKFFI